MAKHILCLLLILCSPYFASSLQCEKVIDLPNDLNSLLPDHDKLNKIHLHHNFFLLKDKEQSFVFNIKEKSVFKLLLVPHHSSIKLSINSRGKTTTHDSKFPDIPIEFSDLTGELHGDITLKITNFPFDEIDHSDNFCNSPYFRMEFSIQEYDSFISKVQEVKKATKELQEFDFNFKKLFKSIPVETVVIEYKLPLSTKSTSKYQNENFTVLKEYELDVEEEKIDKDSIKRFEMQIEIYSDFIFSGSQMIVIARQDEKENLDNFECLKESSCPFSKRIEKNELKFVTVLAPGSYRLFLIDYQDKANYVNLNKLVDYIPVAMKIKFGFASGDQEQFNCYGAIHLPHNITIENKINFKENYELNSEIIMNLQSFYDSTIIKADSDSILRVASFFKNGKKITLELYKGNENMLKVSSHEQTNSLIFSLEKGIEYNLIISYDKSILEENDVDNCYKFHLKIGIMSLNYLQNSLNYPQSCSKNLESHTINEFFDTFEKEHSDKKNYLDGIYTIEAPEKYSFTAENNLIAKNDEIILFSRNLVIKNEIQLYIDIQSDFTSGLLIPFVERETNDKEEHHINLLRINNINGILNVKLTKGNYKFSILRGKNQYQENFTSQNTQNEAIKFFPKCLHFQLKLSSILIETEREDTWCHNEYFQILPKNLNNLRYLYEKKEHFIFSETNFLIPQSTHSTFFRTGHHSLLMKLTAEFLKENGIVKIELKKGDKTLKTAKTAKEGKFESKQTILIFLLKPNSEYILEFTRLQHDKNDIHYYDICRLFSLQIEFTNSDLLSKNNNESCPSINPTLQNGFFERQIGVNNSLHRYGRALFSFSYFFRRKFIDSKDAIDISNMGNTVYQFKKSETKAYEHSVQFQVRYMFSRLFLQIETHFDTILSVYLTRKREMSHEVIAIGEFQENSNSIGFNGINLDGGLYEITIIEASFNKDLNRKFSSCVKYNMYAILENKPFNYGSRVLVQNHDHNCYFNPIPSNLNIPGWIYPDTDYSIASYFTFLVEENSVFKFNLKENSLVKFHFPKENNLFFGLKIFKEHRGKRKDLVEVEDMEDLNFSEFLEEGNYNIEVLMKGIDGSKTKDQKINCLKYEVLISVTPIKRMLKYDMFKSVNCQEEGSLSRVLPETETTHQILVLNKKFKDDFEISKPLEISIEPSSKVSNVIFEISHNFIIDTSFVFHLTKKKENGNRNKEISYPFKSYYSENYSWLIFQTEPNAHYTLTINSIAYDKKTSICSKINYGVVYRSEESEDRISTESSNISKEEVIKNNCENHAEMPESLYKENDYSLYSYGKAQGDDGSISFYGEFSVPKDVNTKRISFLVPVECIIYVKAYNHQNFNNNVLLQIYRDGTNVLFSFSKSIVNGVLMTDIKPFIKDKPHFLEIVFDNHENYVPCDTFTLIVNIIPKEQYFKSLVNCEEKNDQIPAKIVIIKAEELSYQNYFSNENNLLPFHIDTDKNSYLEIPLELTKMFSLNLKLKYLISTNLMEFYLLSHDGKTVLEKSKSSFYRDEDSDSVFESQSIEVELKKGNYTLKLVYKSLFTEMTRHLFFFNEKKPSVCHAFLLELSSLNLDKVIKKKEETHHDQIQSDEEEDTPEIEKIDKKDLLDDAIENFVVSVEPASKKNIKLKKSLKIEIKFQFKVKSATDFSKSFYLQEYKDKKLTGNKIFPENIKADFEEVFIDFNSSLLQAKKCYKLNFDFNVISNTKHKYVHDEESSNVYCTTSCECNPHSKFRCKKDKCECIHPYAGEKCEKCIPGFEINGNHCVESTKLSCDDKKTCNSHGKCVEHGNKFECHCDKGFISTGTKFCNACEDPKKWYPNCLTIEEKLKDQTTFNWSSNCYTSSMLSHSLPLNLHDSNDEEANEAGGVQKSDGSVSFHGIFKIKDEVEITEFIAKEDSVIRVYYYTKGINRAKVQLLRDKDDVRSLASTDGEEANESLLAKVVKRKSPYFIKITHSHLLGACNRFEVLIVVKPIDAIFSHLKCREADHDKSSLPHEKITLGENTSVKENLGYTIAEELVYNEKDSFNFEESALSLKPKTYSPHHYGKSGVISKSRYNDEFVYSVEITVVKNPIHLSAFIEFDFLTNDMHLVLRNDKGNVIANGEVLIPVIEEKVQDKEFVNTVHRLLEPGTYYLTIIQSVSSNMLLQLVNRDKKHSNIKKCFDFNFHIQDNIVLKPDPNISTVKYEALFNRIIDVNPPSYSNLNLNKKFSVFVTFEAPIKLRSNEISGSLANAFYFESEHIKTNKIFPIHAYTQGTPSNRILLMFQKKTLEKNTCYDLKYNLNLLISEESDRKLVDDSPIIHRYCVKECDCNPFTEFECDDSGKCKCEEPYTGPGCYQCQKGFFMAHYRCVNEETCKIDYCTGNGKCQFSINSKPDQFPKCQCDSDFNGSPTCDQCTNKEMTYPDCTGESKLEEELHKEAYPDEIKDKISQDEEEEPETFGTDVDKASFSCAHDLVPENLDTLSFLEINGHFHIASLYSLKQVTKKHFVTKFTVKSRTHFKIYLELSIPSHKVDLVLVYGDEKILGTVETGPNGNSTASFLDAIIEPHDKSSNQKNEYELRYYIRDFSINEEDSDEEITDSESLVLGCFDAFVEMEVMPIASEIELRRNLDSCTNKYPTSLFSHDVNSYNKETGVVENFYYFKRGQSKYFFHDYFYVHDLGNKDLTLYLQVNSKFLYGQIGLLIETLQIPEKINGRKIDLKSINSNEIKGYFKEVDAPECLDHCFSAVKKFNGVAINRIIPSNTFVRIWLYDISPEPIGSKPHERANCIKYEVSYSESEANPFISEEKKYKEAICENDYIPNTLNTFKYLGMSGVEHKQGFHSLEHFRIDHLIDEGFTHTINFVLDAAYIFRVAVYSVKIEMDIEMHYKKDSSENLISKANIKNFESSIGVELPKGEYLIRFKFYPPASGFSLCESIQMEFSAYKIDTIQENVNDLNSKFKGKLKASKINVVEHLQNSEGEDLFQNPSENRYLIEMREPFIVGKDDSTKFEHSIVVAETIFVIKPKDSRKLQLVGYVASDFALFDCSLHLTELGSGKTFSKIHKKNQNEIFSNLLESGEYKLEIKYERRLKVPLEFKSTDELQNANFAEIEFNALFINESNDQVIVETSKHKIKIASVNKKKLPHYFKCRNHGGPVPNSLNTLHYLDLSRDVNIVENFITPPLGEGEYKIKFNIKHLEKNLSIRIYLESKGSVLNAKINKHGKGGTFEVIDESKSNSHFSTLNAVLKPDFEYEIILSFKNSNNENKDCGLFRMGLATEIEHYSSCPRGSGNFLEVDKLYEKMPHTLPLKISGTTNKMSKFIYKSNESQNQHDSQGLVYMRRVEKDSDITISSFEVNEVIDLRFEVNYDFLQSPVTIFISQIKDVEDDFELSKSKKVKSRIHDENILFYSHILENRSLLLIKKLPIGKYSLNFIIPGLKSKSTKDKVCSYYDVSFEAVKSEENFFKSLQSFTETDKNLLDIPVPMPKTLNSLSMWGDSNYMNHHNYYYFTKSQSTANYLLENLKFTLLTDSILRMQIQPDKENHIMKMRIKDKTEFQEIIYTQLPKGTYDLEIKEELKENESPLSNTEFSSSKFALLAGMSDTSRLNEIFTFNDLNENSCSSVSLPSSINIENHKFAKGDQTFIKFENKKVTFKTSDVKDRLIAKMRVIIKENSKFEGILSTDMVLFPLDLKLRSSHNEWIGIWSENVGSLNLNLSPGDYDLLIETEKTLPKSINCILFGIEINIFNLVSTHQKIKKNELINKKEDNEEAYIDESDSNCDRSKILPIELNTHSSDSASRINGKGEFSLHHDKILFIDNSEEDLSSHNSNSVTIAVDQASIIRVTTRVKEAHKYQIIPILRSKKQEVNQKSGKKSLVTQTISEGEEFVNHNLEERNLYYFIKENSNTDYYHLLINKEMGEENHESVNCPYYSIDLMISSVESLNSKLQCPKKSSKVIQTNPPKTNLIFHDKYTESIELAYFTEQQMGDLYQHSKDNSSSFKYSITFDIKQKSMIYFEFGYDHLVSLFDVYLSIFEKVENGDAFESRVLIVGDSVVKSQKDQFPYTRVIHSPIEPGSYVLMLTESMFVGINRQIKYHLSSIHDNANESKLCLPYTYKLEINPYNDSQMARAEIIEISPNGFNKANINEDIKVNLKFNKNLFTIQKIPINSSNQPEYLTTVFYLLESAVAPNKKSKNNEGHGEISPDNVEASENGKDWVLTFPGLGLKIGYEYKLMMRPRMLFDERHFMFITPHELPVFKIEEDTDLELNQNLTEDEDAEDKHFEDLKHKLSDEVIDTTKFENETIAEKDHIENKVKSKCGKHGKETYDNIYKKYLCSCTDGFTGKYCDYCDGVVDKKTGNCIVDENEDEDDDKHDFHDLSDKNKKDDHHLDHEDHYNIHKEEHSEKNDKYYHQDKPSKTEKNYYHEDHHEENKEVTKPCTRCINGFCNGKTGECICDDGWEGVYCDRRKNTQASQSFTALNQAHIHENQSEWSFFTILGKLIYYAVIIGILIYAYLTVRDYFYKVQIEYQPIEGRELESNIHSNLELFDEDHDHDHENNQVEFESQRHIKSLKK